MTQNRKRQRSFLYPAAWLLAGVGGIAVASLLTGCTTGDVAGTGSQAGNAKVTCVVYNDNGSPAAGAEVYLRSHDYTADTTGAATEQRTTLRHDTHTDAQGTFTIDSVDAGTYFIEVNDRNSNAVLVVCDVTEGDTLVRIPDDTLQPTGGVSGSFTMPPDDSAALYIQIYGLERVGVPDTATGNFVIDDVPPGTYTIQVLSSSDEYLPMVFDSTLVASEKATDIGLIDIVNANRWKYSVNLRMNTTAAGADVGSTVVNFPVLVRLRDGTFDFDGARSDGGDLRFKKSDGTPLSYEIERYDAAARQADIWVKLDTVYGNDSTHFFALYWGNPEAMAESEGSAVFSTATGFAGVWHLGDYGDTVMDATGDAFNGYNSGSSVSAGIIGNSRIFSSGDYIRIPGLLNSPASVTLSAWVKTDTSSAIEMGQDIFSIGDVVILRINDINSIGTSGRFHNDSTVNDNAFAVISSGQYLTATDWHYLVYSVNTAKGLQTLYIDGVQSIVAHDTSPIIYAGLGSDTYIGIHGNGKTFFNFAGQIDEMRVNNYAVSANWTKLCFMNQKAQDALLSWQVVVQ